MRGKWSQGGLIALLVLSSVGSNFVTAAERLPRKAARSKTAAPHTAESLATLAKPSVAVISQKGRDGKDQGIGAGVVVSSNLIATCLHVIGEARPLSIRLENGERREATEIFAWDRKLDLAVIRVAGSALRELPLGDSDALPQGAQVVAVGNPLGLEYSIVQGVVSGKREIEQLEMLQLAIPIEAGNSGGPVLDMEGRVQGVLSMKSALSANLGFAIPVNTLKKLIAKPNRIPMDRWLSFTMVRTNQWRPIMGARWSQRGGHIHVEGAGDGFGGRSLLISRAEVPLPPYEVAVDVRLDDESGAAGLVFESDGEDTHYGFYPTSGQLRLTHFQGPAVFSWNILSTIGSPHYRPGDWNHLRVRVEEKKLSCYVNGELVIESTDPSLSSGKVGLAKFRHTKASFKAFTVGTNLAAEGMADAKAETLSEDLSAKSDSELINALKPHGDKAYDLLQRRSRELDQEADRLRTLARMMHQRAVTDEMLAVLSGEESDIDLFHAALLVSRLDNPELDVKACREHLDELAAELITKIHAQASDSERLAALKRFLFIDDGFHGSRTDYYNRANSYIDRVMEDREGIPITLSVVFIELGRRVKLNVAGVPLPGHFVVKYQGRDREQLLDVFDEAAELTREQAASIVAEHGGASLREEYLKPATKRDIIIRMLRNLLRASSSENPTATANYLDVILALTPDSVSDRVERARVRLSLGDRTGAREDLAWILDHEPAGVDLDAVRQFYRSL